MPNDLARFEDVTLPLMVSLYQSAFAILGSQAEAERAVERSFQEAWKAFARLSPGTNFRTWLFRILFKNLPPRRPNGRGTDDQMLDALRALPRPYAEVVLLADVNEFSYAEIEETCGISRNVILERLDRGRQLLSSQLSETVSAATA